MPIRIPKARATEGVAFGLAGLGAFAPFWFMLPGAEERLVTQTTRWAPRWERSISFAAPPVRTVAQRVEPPIARNVRKIPKKLPLERMALGLERGIKRSLDRAGIPRS